MKPTMAQIITAVAEAFQIRPDDITGPSRLAAHSHPRHAVCAIAHECGYSYPQIAGRLGRENHTTIIRGANRAEALADRHDDYREKYQAVRKRFPHRFEEVLGDQVEAARRGRAYRDACVAAIERIAAGGEKNPARLARHITAKLEARP